MCRVVGVEWYETGGKVSIGHNVAKVETGTRFSSLLGSRTDRVTSCRKYLEFWFPPTFFAIPESTQEVRLVDVRQTRF